MNNDIMTHIVKSMVMFAIQKNDPTFQLSLDEMYAFVSILFLSGYVPVPWRRMLWEQSEDTHNIMVSETMRRNKFENIFKYLHVADNQNLPKGDKYGKLRPLINNLNEAFIQHAPIQEQISVDESMIPYFGRHGCKQFI